MLRTVVPLNVFMQWLPVHLQVATSLVILQIWLCRCNGLGTVCGCSLDIHVPEPCLQWGTAELMKPLWGGGGAWWEVHRSLGVPSSEGVLVSSHENLLKQGKAWSLNSCLVLHWDFFFFCIPYAYAICHAAFAKGQWACWSWIQLLSMLPLAANLTQLKLPEKRVLIERLPDQTACGRLLRLLIGVGGTITTGSIIPTVWGSQLSMSL